MTGTGGTAPFYWSATGLPDGLTMDAAGVITGTPTTAGTFNPTVTVVDDFGASNAQELHRRDQPGAGRSRHRRSRTRSRASRTARP